MSDLDLRRVFDTVDESGDGSIDKYEFAALLSGSGGSLSRQDRKEEAAALTIQCALRGRSVRQGVAERRAAALAEAAAKGKESKRGKGKRKGKGKGTGTGKGKGKGKTLVAPPQDDQELEAVKVAAAAAAAEVSQIADELSTRPSFTVQYRVSIGRFCV